MNHVASESVLFYGGNAEQIALTFDDGPNDPHTLEILDLLAEYDAKATFFLLGKWVRLMPDIVRKIHAAGHAIGNHSENHLWLGRQPSEEVAQELELCQKAIEDAIGIRPSLFRPPFGDGHETPRVPGIARRLGLQTVMWSIMADPGDWMAPSVESIVQSVSTQFTARRIGHIIDLHDGGPDRMGEDRRHTVAAVRILLGQYSLLHKRLVSIPELETTPKNR